MEMLNGRFIGDKENFFWGDATHFLQRGIWKFLEAKES